MRDINACFCYAQSVDDKGFENDNSNLIDLYNGSLTLDGTMAFNTKRLSSLVVQGISCFFNVSKINQIIGHEKRQ